MMAVLLPPVSLLMCGKVGQFFLSIPLTLCCWLPGVIHALFVVASHEADIRNNALIKEIRRAGMTAVPQGLPPAVARALPSSSASRAKLPKAGDFWVRGDGSFGIEAVGESHYQRELESICGSRTRQGIEWDTTAELVLEDANPYDLNNAVRVDIDGRTVGYLSRSDASTLRRRLSSSFISPACLTVAVKIRGGWDRGPQDQGAFEVVIDARRPFTFETDPNAVLDASDAFESDEVKSPKPTPHSRVRATFSGAAVAQRASELVEALVEALGEASVVLGEACVEGWRVVKRDFRGAYAALPDWAQPILWGLAVVIPLLGLLFLARRGLHP